MNSISGKIISENNDNLKSGSIVELKVFDVSAPCLSNKVVGSLELEDQRRFPINFEIKYEFKSGHRYAISCEIKKDNELLFVNPGSVSMFDNQTGETLQYINLPVQVLIQPSEE